MTQVVDHEYHWKQLISNQRIAQSTLILDIDAKSVFPRVDCSSCCDLGEPTRVVLIMSSIADGDEKDTL